MPVTANPDNTMTSGLYTPFENGSISSSTAHNRTDIGSSKRRVSTLYRECRLSFLFTPSRRRSKSADPTSVLYPGCQSESSVLTLPLVGFNGSLSKDKLKSSPVNITGSVYDHYRRLRDLRRAYSSQVPNGPSPHWSEFSNVVSGKSQLNSCKCNNPLSAMRFKSHPRPSSFHPRFVPKIPVSPSNSPLYQDFSTLSQDTPQSDCEDSATNFMTHESLYDRPPSIAPYPCPTFQPKCSATSDTEPPSIRKTPPSFSSRMDPTLLFRRRRRFNSSSESDLANSVNCVSSLRLWKLALSAGSSASRSHEKHSSAIATSAQTEGVSASKSGDQDMGPYSQNADCFNTSRTSLQTNGSSRDICKVTVCHSSPKLYPNVVHHAVKGKVKSNFQACSNQTEIHFDSALHCHNVVTSTPEDKNVWEPKQPVTSDGIGSSRSVTLTFTSATPSSSRTTTSLRTRFKLQRATKKDPLDRGSVPTNSSVLCSRLRLCSNRTETSSDVVSARSERCSSVYSSAGFRSETISIHSDKRDITANNPTLAFSHRNSWSASTKTWKISQTDVPTSVIGNCCNAFGVSLLNPSESVSLSTMTVMPFVASVSSVRQSQTHTTSTPLTTPVSITSSEHRSRGSIVREPSQVPPSHDNSSSNLSMQSFHESPPIFTAPVLRPPRPPLRTTSLVRCEPRTICRYPPSSIPCSTVASSLSTVTDRVCSMPTCSQPASHCSNPTVAPLDNADRLADREVELVVSELDSMWWLHLLPYKPSNLPDNLADRLRQRSSLMLSRSSPNTRLSNSSLPLTNSSFLLSSSTLSPHLHTMTQSLHERHPPTCESVRKTPSDTSSKLCPRPPTRPSSLYTESTNKDSVLLPSLAHLLSVTKRDVNRCIGFDHSLCQTSEFTPSTPTLCFSKPRMSSNARRPEGVANSFVCGNTDSPLLGQYCRLLILRATNPSSPSSTPTALPTPSAETPIAPV